MEEIQNAALDKLEKSRTNDKITEKYVAILALEKKLAEEQAKSRRLEEKLAPFLAAAAAAAST